MQTPNSDETAAKQLLVNSYFDEEAGYWREIYERDGVKEFVHQERLRRVLRLAQRAGLTRSARVLDVGCGAGLAAVALAERGHFVEAIDPVEAMVESTRHLAKKAGVEGRLKSSLGDLRSLPFPDKSFSLVVSIGVLPWLPSIEKPISEMSRLVRPSGYLIATVDNRWSLCRFLDPLRNPLVGPAKERAKRVLRKVGFRKTESLSHLTSTRECDAALDAAGLEKIEGTTLGFGPFSLFNRELLPFSFGLRMHRGLQALADCRVPVFSTAGSQYLVLARKRVA